MSVLRTWRSVTLSSLSSPSSSQIVNYDSLHSLSLGSPKSRHFLALKVTERFILTRHPSHLIKMDESSSITTDSVSSSSASDYCEIIVVRHGETAWNADGRIQGHLDVELNDVGREQAVSVADRLSNESGISVVYSSDLKRALETGRTIASRCGGLKVIEDPDLRERHLGELQGLVLREAAQVSPAAYKAFVCRKTSQDIPGGGESLDHLYQRCTSALQRIAKKHKGERVVVVTHGGVIRTLYKRACPNEKFGGKVLNTSINIFLLSGEDEWVIKSWGDVSHLNQTGFLKSGFGGDSTSG